MDDLDYNQPPDDLTGLQVRPALTSAAGLPSVVSALHHIVGKMGAIRGLRTMLSVNQKGGFDCMSCAWPDPDGHRSHIAEYCENGAKAVSDEATLKRVTEEFFATHSINELTRQSDYWLNGQGRLTRPMIRRKGSGYYEAIGWDDAFSLVAEELKALESPDEAVFYTSGRTSNEAAFLFQLFVRMFGTNNLPDCSNMCHESSGAALAETIGSGKGTVWLEDFEAAELIILIGQNPGTNHPRMLATLQKAKRRGAKVIAINPLREAGLTRFRHPQQMSGLFGSGTALADHYLQVRINGDGALLKGLMKALLEFDEGVCPFDAVNPIRRPLRDGVLDRNFIERCTSGSEELLKSLRGVSWDEIVARSGVRRDEIMTAAQMLGDSKATICCWAMGLTQHRDAVATIQEIVNLMLLQGNIGKPGAGLCPVRGHSNVQGDRTVGIWERPKPEFLDALEREFAFSAPRRHGLDTVAAISAMQSERAKVFVAMGGNFLSAAPDTEFTARALRRCRLTVHVSTKLNRAHLVTGGQALILPCLGRSERDIQMSGPQFVTTENSMGVIQSSQGVNEPASAGLLSEPMIVARLAVATLGASGPDWLGLASDYDRIRDSIERVVPGFENYNVRARRAGGFYLPNAPRGGIFRTQDGKARFTVHPIPTLELQDDELLMMTIRSHDQFNTTIYGLDDRYRGIFNERRVVFMNAGDIERLGHAAGDVVDLESGQGKHRARRFIIVAYDIPMGCCATYFPEANVLVPIESVAEKSNTPASKSVVIRLLR